MYPIHQEGSASSKQLDGGPPVGNLLFFKEINNPIEYETLQQGCWLEYMNNSLCIFQIQEMSVMKFVQLFILKRKLRESMVLEDNGFNGATIFQCSQTNELLDLTCINCKEKYMQLMEKLKIIQSFVPRQNDVSITSL